MDETKWQVGKTSSTHYTIAYHLVWRAKYHRRALTGEAQKETTRLIGACCEQHGLTLLAMETEEDHMQVFVSAPPRFSPAMIANLLKRHSSRYLRERFPHFKKGCGKEHVWTQSYIGWHGISRNDQAIPYAVSRQVGRFHPAPCNGAGLPAPLVKGWVDHGQFEPCMRASSRIGTRQAHRKENATNGK